MIVVLVVASGSAWEPPALGLLTAHPNIVVLKRCVDVDDLLAAASAGQADVAVLGLDAPGLDVGAVDLLRKYAVRPVAIVSAAAADAAALRAARLGLPQLIVDDHLDDLPNAVLEGPPVALPTQPAGAPHSQPTHGPPTTPPPTGPRGRVIAVWGPAGAPGRSTVASALAAVIAQRQRHTVLVDADPYGGTIAQQLGILDEVSGLLSAARLALSGHLTERLETVQRAVDRHLSVVTGLPRPDRWVEMRAGAIEHLLEVAKQHAEVVVDTGFSLEEDPSQDFGTRPGRNSLTLGALGAADEAVVVGSADPVGLSRLARGLVELHENLPGLPTRVVVNRMRPSLGWREDDIAGMLRSVSRPRSLHFLPDDRPGIDRALVAGKTLPEAGDSAFLRAIGPVVEALAPVS